MKNAIIFVLLLIQLQLSSQEINLDYIVNNLINLNRVSKGNENFEGFEKIDSLLKGVEIVMLGEQTHQDATTFETKIKLIKYLHEKLGFTVLAFESSMYECEKAWDGILNGDDIRMNLGQSVNTFWSPLDEFKDLTDYIENSLGTEHPLEVKGFDNQIGGAIAHKTLTLELKKYLKKTEPSLINEKILNLLNDKLLKNLWYMEFNKFKKKDAKVIIEYLNKIEITLEKKSDDQSKYWLKHINNLSSFISDLKLGTEFRDKEMAKNLIWLKENNPNKKIICWGATSHFLYNSKNLKLLKPIKSIEQHFHNTRMMGDYIKEKYQEKVYTIGFTAYEGEYGTIGFGINQKIEPATQNSLEYLLNESGYENFILPFDNNSNSALISRPLGYIYIKTDVSTLMDAVIFNKTMKRPSFDLELFKKLYPNHKHIK